MNSVKARKEVEKRFSKGLNKRDELAQEVQNVRDRMAEAEKNMDFEKIVELEDELRKKEYAQQRFNEKYVELQESNSKELSDMIHQAYREDMDKVKAQANKDLEKAAEFFAQGIKIVENVQQRAKQEHKEVSDALIQSSKHLHNSYRQYLRSIINLDQPGRVKNFNTLKVIYRDNWGLLPDDPGNKQG